MDAVATIAGVVEKLFGKVGAALLLATGAFFLCPQQILGAVGLDNTDHDLRRTFGFLFIFSLAACAVSVAIAIWSFISAKAPGWWEARRVYNRLSADARIVLGQMEMLGETSIVLSARDPAAQDLIDAGLLRVGGRSHGQLKLVKAEKYRDFVSRYRTRLRAILAEASAQGLNVFSAVTAAQRFERLTIPVPDSNEGQKGTGK